MYSEKLTRSALGPETPRAEWDDSFVILSRFDWYMRIDLALLWSAARMTTFKID